MATPSEPWRRRRGANVTDTEPRMSTRVVGPVIPPGVKTLSAAWPDPSMDAVNLVHDTHCACGYHVCSKTGPCAPKSLLQYALDNRLLDGVVECEFDLVDGNGDVLREVDLHTVSDAEAECVFVVGDRVTRLGRRWNGGRWTVCADPMITPPYVAVQKDGQRWAVHHAYLEFAP